MDWWVKSVATKLLIPYDEVGTSVLGRSSRIDGGIGDEREEHEERGDEHKGHERTRTITNANSMDRGESSNRSATATSGFSRSKSNTP